MQKQSWGGQTELLWHIYPNLYPGFVSRYIYMTASLCYGLYGGRMLEFETRAERCWRNVVINDYTFE